MSASIDFNNIPPHNAPFPFWFWNGLMEPDEIRRQIRLMRSSGITEFLIHARYGLKTEYLSDAWFGAVGAAVDEAAKTGMRAWIYDEMNWPSGSAGGKVTSDVALREHYLDPDGNLQPTKTAADASPDYLNATAVKKFIRLTHEEYFKRFRGHFGKAIPGFFNDEVRFANARPWSESLGKVPERNTDYYRVIARKISGEYFRRIAAWCKSRSVKLIGHVMGEETLGSNVRYMADIFACLEQFHEPGIDHLGTSAEGFHHRPAATLGRLLGRPVTCETGAGLPWDFKIGDLYRISGWLYANGITRIILHGFYHTENPTDWPPDMFFRWNGWPEMKDYISWASAVQYFLSRARPVRRVCLYYPLEEFWSDYRADPGFTLNFSDKGPQVAGDRALGLHVKLQELSSRLYSRNVDFDLAPQRWLPRLKDSILVVPSGCKPDFKGRTVLQENRSVEETVEAVEKLLGARPKFNVNSPAPRETRAADNFSDPYVHGSGDQGGVLIREYLLGARRAWIVWNANNLPFEGTVDLAGVKDCLMVDPAHGTERSEASRDVFNVQLKPYSMKIILS